MIIMAVITIFFHKQLTYSCSNNVCTPATHTHTQMCIYFRNIIAKSLCVVIHVISIANLVLMNQ